MKSRQQCSSRQLTFMATWKKGFLLIIMPMANEVICMVLKVRRVKIVFWTPMAEEEWQTPALESPGKFDTAQASSR